MFMLLINRLSKIADWQSKACFKIFLTFNKRTLQILFCLILVTRPFLKVNESHHFESFIRTTGSQNEWENN